MNTIKLYDENAYAVEFTASVVQAVPLSGAERLLVILDRTLFFPEEGGQTPDFGVLEGFPVTDVQIKDGVITHTIACGDPSLFPEGKTVCGKIDWEHRFSNMQNHTGEHILSGILHSVYGYENVGFRLSENTVTLDTSGQLDDEQIRDLELRANRVVWQNLAVTAAYPPAEELEKLEYRSKISLTEGVRLVTIPGVDVCACCAPHVARTGEIGLIKIIGVLHNKKNMRLTIVCGKRALEEMQLRQTQLEEISHLTSRPADDAASGVHKLLEEISQLKEKVTAAELIRVTSIVKQHKDELEASGAEIASSCIFLFEKELSPLAQRSLMNGLCDLGLRFAGVFTGDDETGYRYLIGSRADDARVPNAVLKERFSAKGGGKPEMVQGSVSASEEMILAALASGGCR